MNGQRKKETKKPADDIEKYRDPEKLFQKMQDSVSSLREHLSRFRSFNKDAEIIKCHQLLDRFLQETRPLVPSIGRLDFADVPANGLRSCLRLWIEFILIALEMNNEVKLRKFVIALSNHLSLWPPLIRDSVACITSGQFDASASRQQINYFYSTYDRKTHGTLLKSKLMLKTFDATMYPFLMIFLRIGVWSTEPSWKRKLFSEHYLTYTQTLRSLLKRLDIVRPESIAAWVRCGNWFTTQIFVSSVNSLMHPWRGARSRVHKRKFRILCPSKYCIRITNDAISLVPVDHRGPAHSNDSRNNNNNSSDNNNDTVSDSENGDGKSKTLAAPHMAEFFVLRSAREPKAKSPQRAEQVATSVRSGGEEGEVAPEKDGVVLDKDKLVRMGGGRCAFFSQRKVKIKSQCCEKNNGVILIYIHGGAFFGPKSASLINIFLRDWSSRLPGVTLIVPEYSYAPETSFPVAWQEMLDLYIWLVSSTEASELLDMDIDARKIVLAGDSSGGCLASSLLVMLNEINRKFQQSIPIPREVVLLFPKCSLRLEFTPSLLLSNYDLVLNGFLLARVAQAVLPITKRNPQTNQATLISPTERKNLHPEWFKSDEYQVLDSPILSPLGYDRWADLSHVNLNVVVITFDPLMDDGVHLAKCWKGPVNLHVADNVCHGAFYFRQFAPCGDSFSEKSLAVVSSAIDALSR